MLAERAARMEGAEQLAVLEQRHGAVDEPFEIAPRLGGREVEAVHGAAAVPVGDQLGEVDGAAPVVRSMRRRSRSTPLAFRPFPVFCVSRSRRQQLQSQQSQESQQSQLSSLWQQPSRFLRDHGPSYSLAQQVCRCSRVRRRRRSFYQKPRLPGFGDPGSGFGPRPGGGLPGPPGPAGAPGLPAYGFPPYGFPRTARRRVRRVLRALRGRHVRHVHRARSPSCRRPGPPRCATRAPAAHVPACRR